MLKKLSSFLFAISLLWTFKPISYEELAYNNYIREKTIQLRVGTETGKGNAVSQSSTSFINPQFVGKKSDSTSTSRDLSSNRKPKFQPKGNPGSGGNGAGAGANWNSDYNEDKLDKNAIPNEAEWIGNREYWKKLKKDNDQCSIDEEFILEDEESIREDEESIREDKKDWKKLIDFDFELDYRGNPRLLIPNLGAGKNGRPYNIIDFDQTATHLHHAKDFSIPLPKEFDVDKYRRLSRSEKIEYALKHVSPETIIQYQNVIGRSMIPRHVPGETDAVIGFVGTHKVESDLIIQEQDTTSVENKNILSVVRKSDGVHMSSYGVTDEKLKRIKKGGYWIWRNRQIKGKGKGN